MFLGVGLRTLRTLQRGSGFTAKLRGSELRIDLEVLRPERTQMHTVMLLPHLTQVV